MSYQPSTNPCMPACLFSVSHPPTPNNHQPTLTQLLGVARLMADELNDRLKPKNISLTMTDNALLYAVSQVGGHWCVVGCCLCCCGRVLLCLERYSRSLRCSALMAHPGGLAACTKTSHATDFAMAFPAPAAPVVSRTYSSP